MWVLPLRCTGVIAKHGIFHSRCAEASVVNVSHAIAVFRSRFSFSHFVQKPLVICAETTARHGLLDWCCIESHHKTSVFLSCCTTITAQQGIFTHLYSTVVHGKGFSYFTFYRTSGKTWALKLQQASPLPSLLEDLSTNHHPTKFLHFHFDIDFGKGIKRAPFPLRLHPFRWVCLPTSQHTISAAHRFQFQLRLPLGHVFVCINLRHATNQWWVTFVINIRSNNQHHIIIIINDSSSSLSWSLLHVPHQIWMSQLSSNIGENKFEMLVLYMNSIACPMSVFWVYEGGTWVFWSTLMPFRNSCVLPAYLRGVECLLV